MNTNSQLQVIIKLLKEINFRLSFSKSLFCCSEFPACNRYAGFTCLMIISSLPFAGLTNASLRKPPALSADSSLMVGNIDLFRPTFVLLSFSFLKYCCFFIIHIKRKSFI